PIILAGELRNQRRGRTTLSSVRLSCTQFGLFWPRVSGPEIPFPGNRDFGSKRPSSNLRSLKEADHFVVLRQPHRCPDGHEERSQERQGNEWRPSVHRAFLVRTTATAGKHLPHPRLRKPPFRKPPSAAASSPRDESNFSTTRASYEEAAQASAVVETGAPARRPLTLDYGMRIYGGTLPAKKSSRGGAKISTTSVSSRKIPSC